MILIYVIIAFIVGAAASLVLGFFLKNKTLTIAITVILMALSVFAARDYAFPYYFAYTFSASIRSASPLIDLIAETSPADFNLYMAKIKENILNDENPDDIYLYTNGLIAEELTRAIPNASNESIYNYLSACLEVDKKLMKVNPTLVLFIEFPDKFINQVNLNDIYRDVGQDALDNLLIAKTNIIQSAFSNRQPGMNLLQKLTANLMFAAIMSDLSQQYGRKNIEDTFENPDDPVLDKQKAAEIIIQYYEAILAKDKDNAGMIYKSLFTDDN